mmetsp:Transcript_9022/g.20717  ORF Transcript_9022/g.20717 Transcript_9022/m.20717 type:complete len:306 (+) Transcript_9022:124-1041(+)
MKRVQAACAGALFGTLVVIGVACLVWTPAQVGQPTELRQFKVTIIPPRARGVYGQRYMIPGRPLVPAIAPNFANVRSRKSSSLRRLRRLLGSQNKGVRRLEKRVGRLARVMRKERSRAAARLRRITKLLKKRSKAAQKGAGEKQILQATLKKMMAAINAKVADLKAKLKKASIADNAKVNKARRQARMRSRRKRKSSRRSSKSRRRSRRRARGSRSRRSRGESAAARRRNRRLRELRRKYTRLLVGMAASVGREKARRVAATAMESMHKLERVVSADISRMKTRVRRKIRKLARKNRSRRNNRRR